MIASFQRRPRSARLAVAVLGLAAGASLGVGVATTSGALDTAPAHQAAPATEAGVIDAVHVPPTLVAPGERVVLRYDIICPPPAETESSDCVGSGTVFLRPGHSGAFAPLALRLDEDAPEGRYRVEIPAAVVGSPDGFSYYAILRDKSSGATITLPAGGAAAPQQALPLRDPVEIDLGSVDFDSAERPDAEVASAAWGDGPNDIGLESGRQSALGASSFAVSRAGAVYVLDEAHRRALRWTSSATPASIPLSISGTQADLALGGDGSLYVLEGARASVPTPVLRAFDRNGKAFGATRLAERTAAAIESADDDVFTLSYPSGQWLPVATGVDAGPSRALPAEARAQGARSGRPAPDGHQVLVIRDGSETRLALVQKNAVLRSWRLTSSVDLGEIQLAKPLGSGLLVVAHPFTDDRDQFLVLVLGPRGLVRRFGVAANGWAETAPLARFRLVGSSLYQLGSDERTVFVHRFDLGGIS